jgi:hypothetical protein
LVNAEATTVAFPFEHAKGRQAAGDVMQLRPLRTGLTAGQVDVILAHPDHLFELSPEAVEPPYLRSRQCQAVRGKVLGAVSDHQDFEAAWEPAGSCPVGMAPKGTDGVTVEATVLLQAAAKVPAIVPKALQQGSRRVPRVDEDIVGATAQSMASITQPLQGQGIL